MESLVGVFRKDHERLDVRLEAARQEARQGPTGAARAAFAEFRRGIERHMAVEEALLFPAYEARHGADNPLTSTLRKGHADLRVFFSEMDESLAEDDAEEFLALADTVGQILLHHDRKEEDELYPVVAQWLPEAGREAVAGLQAA